MCGKEEREKGVAIFLSGYCTVCVYELETVYKMNEICW